MAWEFDHLEDAILNELPKSQRILNMAYKSSLQVTNDNDSDLRGVIDYIKQLERIIHILLTEDPSSD